MLIACYDWCRVRRRWIVKDGRPVVGFEGRVTCHRPGVTIGIRIAVNVCEVITFDDGTGDVNCDRFAPFRKEADAGEDSAELTNRCHRRDTFFVMYTVEDR